MAGALEELQSTREHFVTAVMSCGPMPDVRTEQIGWATTVLQIPPHHHSKSWVEKYYRGMSKFVHPDKNVGCDSATQAYKSCQMAKDVLLGAFSDILNSTSIVPPWAPLVGDKWKWDPLIFDEEAAMAASREANQDMVNRYAALDNHLASFKKQRIQIRPDGNCQFQAFSKALAKGGMQVPHDVLRVIACDHLSEMRDVHENVLIYCRERRKVDAKAPIDVPTYLDKMREPGTWGDEWTLLALVDRYA